MSSTNRSKARESHVADYYVTPIPAIKDFLKQLLNTDYDKLFLTGIVLDPCAGGDEKNPMSYPTAISEMYRGTTINFRTMDIREDSLASIKGDYLKTELDYKPTVIITNPPFNLAQEIIEKALKDVADKGIVVMLCRLNFLGSKGRLPFWKRNMPARIYVHAQRMKFMNTGGTDSIEYAHMVWLKGYNPEFSKITII